MSAPNIDSVSERCARDCRILSWSVTGYGGDIGNVRRCEHGNIWRCAEYWYRTGWGRWVRLSRFWDPLRYRRAARLLATPPAPTTRKDTP
jgi:hypothetical protein